MTTAPQSRITSEVLQSLHTLENIVFLKKAPLFSAVETADLKAIALIARESDFKDGELIVRENEVGDSMYIIKSGTVAITKLSRNEAAIELAVLSRGDCFGDMAVLDTEVRSASARARGPCVLLSINRDNLMDVILEYPAIAVGLLKTFANRLRKANATIESLADRRMPEASAPKEIP